MSNRPLLLEVDLLTGLQQLAARPGPHVLVTSLSEPDLVALLVREARVFHETEADEARARLQAALQEAERLKDEPGEAHAEARAAVARAELARHEQALATATLAAAAAVLAGWQRVEDASKAPVGAVVATLAADGWSLIEDQSERDAARADLLGR